MGELTLLANDSTKAFNRYLGVYGETVNAFKAIDWDNISNGMKQILLSRDMCSADDAKLVEEISRNYRLHANSYFFGAQKVREKFSTVSASLDKARSGSYEKLVKALPTKLEKLATAIKKYNETLEKIVDGLAEIHSKLEVLKMRLQSSKPELAKTIGIVMGAIVAGGVITFCGAWLISGAIVATKLTVGCTLVGAAAGGACGATYCYKKGCDIRELIELNRNEIDDLNQKLDKLEGLIRVTSDENSNVNCCVSSAEDSYEFRKVGDEVIDDDLLQKVKELVETCENHLKTDDSQPMKIW